MTTKATIESIRKDLFGRFADVDKVPSPENVISSFAERAIPD